MAALDRAAAGAWEPFASPGEGQDWRLGDEQYSGSALVWEDRVVVHLQMFLGQPKSESGVQSAYQPRVRRRNGPRA